jgi:hypothetical protein
MKKKDRYELAAGSSMTPVGQIQKQSEYRGYSNKSTSKSCMQPLFPTLTLASRISFMMMPYRSSTSAMAAAPWWIEHSPSSVTSGWKQRPSAIDTTWRNVITWHYAACTSSKRSTLTTRHSSPLLDTWLTPEALAGLEPSSFPTHSQTFQHTPNQLQHHPNLSPYHHRS